MHEFSLLLENVVPVLCRGIALLPLQHQVGQFWLTQYLLIYIFRVYYQYIPLCMYLYVIKPINWLILKPISDIATLFQGRNFLKLSCLKRRRQKLSQSLYVSLIFEHKSVAKIWKLSVFNTYVLWCPRWSCPGSGRNTPPPSCSPCWRTSSTSSHSRPSHSD